MFISARIKTVAALALFLALQYPCISQTATSIPQTVSAKESVTPLILTTSVVNKKGYLVGGLKRDNFHVFIDKLPADIIDFREDDAPLSVGIVFDASGSVGYPQPTRPVKLTQEGLKTFLETSNKANEYFVMAFNLSPELLLDWTSDSKAIINSLGTLQPKGHTAFYDACYLALDKVRHGRHSKQVLLLITDGMDNLSTYSLTQVRDELKRSGILVYALNFSDTLLSESTYEMESRQILTELSSVSGGRFFYQRYGRHLTASDAVSAFEIIAQELRHQYAITVTPGISSDEKKWHKVKIKVEAPEDKHLSARTREGFYLSHR